MNNKKIIVWSVAAIVAMILIWRISVAIRRFRIGNAARAEVNSDNLLKPTQFYKNLATKAYNDFWGCFDTILRWGGCDDESASATVTVLKNLNDDELKAVANNYRTIYKRSLRTDTYNYRWWIFNEPADLKDLKKRFDELSIS